jgi:alpha-beta hydrolase superfamily lysophospholipase
LAGEQLKAHYAYRRLAEALEAIGLLVVRFDYDGTGDSAGSDEDPARVQAWLDGIGHAVELARRTGAPSVSLVGMRMGALLAAVSAARLGHDVASLVLWDPCVSGRAFVREQQFLQRLSLEPADTPRRDRRVEFPGFVFREDTAKDLSDLQVPAPTGPPPHRILVLTRADRRAASELVSPFGGDHIEWQEAVGQQELLGDSSMLHPHPEGTIDAITSWLGAAVGTEYVPTRVPMCLEASWSVSGDRWLKERLVRLGSVGLFGIETTALRYTTGPTIMLLNSGNNSHVGPHRLWVELSRRWAAAGLRCVRFDLSGLGDSPVRDGQPDHVILAPEAFDDVADVAAALSPDHPSDVVLVGLCSGAYQALESALRLSPRGVCAINPVFRFTPPEMATRAVDIRRRVCLPTGALVTAYRGLNFPLPRRRVRSITWWLTNVVRRRAPRSWLPELVARRVDTLCICGEDEARPLSKGIRVAARHRHLLRVETIIGLHHTLASAAGRRQVSDLVTHHLLERFGPEASAFLGHDAEVCTGDEQHDCLVFEASAEAHVAKL